MRSVMILILASVVWGCAVEATDETPAAQVEQANQLAGEVLETFDAASYTYVRFETEGGEEWAALPQVRLEIGERIAIANAQAMSNFESKTLGRTFETIYFGTLESPGRPASSTVGAGGPITVAKAEGTTGRTIAQLYSERSELSGKAVALRGRVVKYNAGIMGRNWIHLQDGTGDASDGTNDITVTTSGTTAVGETVLVQGTVAVDRDFGSGYSYDVIVEDARVVPPGT